MNERWVSTESHRQRIISLGGVRFNVINLTEPLQLDTAVFPGDPVPVRIAFSAFTDNLYQHHQHVIGEHLFHPHGDAPNHFDVEREEGFEYWNLDFAFNSACLIDLSQTENSSKCQGITFVSLVTKADLLPFIDQLNQNSALIIRTGYDKWLEANFMHNPKSIPCLSKCAAEFIASFENIKVFGIDSLTVDKSGENYAHMMLKTKLIVESLVNLYSIPCEHRSNFFLQTSPIAIKGATGGPIVAYAYIAS